MQVAISQYVCIITCMKIIKTQTITVENKDKRYPEIKKMREDGMSLEKIGKVFKVSRERIRQILLPQTKKIYTYKCEDCGEKTINSGRISKKCQSCFTKKLNANRQKRFVLQEIFKNKPKWKQEGRERNREIVRFLDDYTCQMCFKVWHKGQRSFDIHHLNGQCGKNSRGYDSLSNVENMITLCHKCHFNHPEHSLKTK